MHRWKAALSALLFTAVLAIGSAGQATATTAYVPLHQFGFSDGPLADDTSPTDMSTLMGDNASVLNTSSGAPNGSFFRGSVHWDPTSVRGPFGSSGTNYTKYDTVIANAWANGLSFLPEIHTSWPSGTCPSGSPGCYIDPLKSVTCPASDAGCGDSKFEAAVTAFAERYGPGGSYYTDNPGSTVPPITRYEIWNEPNTPTGNAQYCPGISGCSTWSTANDLPPADMDDILHDESQALITAATQPGNNWLNQLQIVCCALGNAGDLGNHTYSQDYFEQMMADGSTVWSDLNPSSAMPGVISVHMYYGTAAPGACVDSNGILTSSEKCDSYLGDYWFPYIASTQSAEGFPSGTVGMGITEGGYSGPTNNGTGACSDTGTVAESSQATYNQATISYYRTQATAATNPLDLEFLAYYKAIDTNVSTDMDPACHDDGLAAVKADGTPKLWGTSLKADNSDTVTNVTPSDASPPTVVSITGTGFSNGVTEVDFGGVASPDYTVNSDTSLTAEVPYGAVSGLVTVKIYAGSASWSSFTVDDGTAYDLYSRTDSSGNWGSASQYGGAYSLSSTGSSSTSDFSVSSGQGIIADSGTGTDTASLSGKLDTQDDSVEYTLPSLPASGKTVTAILDSRIKSGSYYQARFQTDHTGSTTVTVRKIVSGDPLSPYTISSTSAACTIPASTQVLLTFDVWQVSPLVNLAANCYGGYDAGGSDDGSSYGGANLTAGTNSLGLTTNQSGGLTAKFDDLQLFLY